MKTHELSLTFSVGLLAMAAHAARSTSVAGIHGEHRHAGQLPLVGDEGLQLSKGPTRVSRPVFLANRCPLADVGQVFQPDPACGVFGGLDKGFAENVVLIAAEVGLALGEFFQPPLGTLGACPLEGTSGLVATSPYLLGDLPRMSIAVAVRRDVDDPEIDPQEVLDLDPGVFGNNDRRIEMELPVAVDEINLPLEPVEPLALILAEDDRDDFAALQDGQAHLVEPLEGQNAFVISDGAAWPEDGADRLVSLENLDRLTDGANGELSRQPKPLPDLAVGDPVNAGLRENFGVEAALGGKRRGFVEPLHDGQEFGLLVIGREQAKPQREVHAYIVGRIPS